MTLNFVDQSVQTSVKTGAQPTEFSRGQKPSFRIVEASDLASSENVSARSIDELYPNVDGVGEEFRAALRLLGIAIQRAEDSVKCLVEGDLIGS
jgi:hypothetical protein